MNADEELTMGNRPFVFRFTDFEVREREFGLIKDGEVLPVEPKAFRVLLFLLRNPQKLITKDELLNAVWGDTAVSENSLARSIALLRRLLGDDPRDPRFIATVPTVGYRFLCPVDRSEESLVRPASANQQDHARGPLHKVGVLDSVAVLPFAHPGHPFPGDYLGESLAAELVASLSQIPELQVIPSETVRKYKDRGLDAMQAGRELGVRLVVTGQLSVIGELVSVKVDFSDSWSERLVWAGEFRQSLSEIFKIQADMTERIVGCLKFQPSDVAQAKLSRPPTDDPGAYHNFLRAIHWTAKFTPEGLRKGVHFARLAIDDDPAFARAWAALGILYVMIGYVDGATPLDVFPLAKAAALKALEIDTDDADAHAVLSFVHLLFDWDWKSAHEEVVIALTLRPDLAVGHFILSHWYLSQGLFKESLSEARIASAIDPLSDVLRISIGQLLYLAGRHGEAEAHLESALALNPNSALAYQGLAMIHAQQNLPEKAIAAHEKGFQTSKDEVRRVALRGIIDGLTGNRLAVKEALAGLSGSLKPPHFASAYHSAVLHALLDEADAAFKCLEMARQGKSNRLIYLAVAPNLRNLWSDRRFADLISRIGIPDIAHPS